MLGLEGEGVLLLSAIGLTPVGVMRCYPKSSTEFVFCPGESDDVFGKMDADENSDKASVAVARNCIQGTGLVLGLEGEGVCIVVVGYWLNPGSCVHVYMCVRVLKQAI